MKRPLAADPHSFARPNEVRTTHLELDWTVDFERRELRGHALYRVERLAPNAPCVLDTRDLAIQAVTDVDGRALRHELGRADAILGRALSVELPAGVDSFRVEYHTTAAGSGLQWLSPEQTAGKRAPYLFSQAQAIHARTMLPCQDSPGVRVTYRARVRVPAGLTAVMSAQTRSAAAGGSELRFEMPRPIPPYLIAIAVGDLEFVSTGPRSGVWAEPSVVRHAAQEFEDLESMIDAVESLFGPYRWGRYDVLVLPPSFPFGGMENPCMTFATPTLLAGDKSLVNVIAHELAHSWSGNLVTNATWNDFWLNEGFTVYLERRILERIFGERAALQDAILGREDLVGTIAQLPAADTRLRLELSGRDPDDGMTDVAYEKGCLLLTELERRVGRSRFDSFLRAWFDEHAFQPVDTDEFVRFVRERLFAGDSEGLARFDFDGWLNGAGLLPDAPDFDRGVFAAPIAAASDVAAGRRSAAQLDTRDWNTAEWLHFIARLPTPCPRATLTELDAAFGLTQRTNAEIAAAWLELCVRSDHSPAWTRLESFLETIGRRKFLKPLYTALVATPEGRERAKRIYARARPGYHPIAQSTLDKLIGEAP